MLRWLGADAPFRDRDLPDRDALTAHVQGSPIAGWVVLYQVDPYRRRAVPRRVASSLWAYRRTMAGDCQRPSCMVSASGAPAATRDWADPTRGLWPVAPSVPAAAARLRTMARTPSVLRRAPSTA